MKRNRSSMTAMGIAMARALEFTRPADERIVADPFARYFVNGALLAIGKFFVGIGYSEFRGPGVMGFLTVRERYIDDYLQQCLDDGIRQLVILGAGYDCRAYRFEGIKGQVKVYEVDHPATQQVKMARLQEILGALPGNVVFVSIDFNVERLDERLYASGYDRSLKTLFIWQGVIYYLTPEAVDGTLAFVAQNSGAGSSIIFDYIYTSLLDGTVKHGEVSGMRRYRRFTGEGLTFGIPEGTIEGFLEQRGFCRVVNATHVDLERAYCTGANHGRQVAGGYAIASATVRPQNEEDKA